jgi:hypothetical protein
VRLAYGPPVIPYRSRRPRGARRVRDSGVGSGRKLLCVPALPTACGRDWWRGAASSGKVGVRSTNRPLYNSFPGPRCQYMAGRRWSGDEWRRAGDGGGGAERGSGTRGIGGEQRWSGGNEGGRAHDGAAEGALSKWLRSGGVMCARTQRRRGRAEAAEVRARQQPDRRAGTSGGAGTAAAEAHSWSRGRARGRGGGALKERRCMGGAEVRL